MSTAVAQAPSENGTRHKPHEQLPAIAPPRLPYHPAIAERFGVDKASWKALVEAIFPNATSTESVILALSYCRARKLDPFKRNVHIVPIWNKELRRYIDTIWPGIGELRTTAFRTGEYAGRGKTEYGPDLTTKVGSLELTFPEWAQVTVARMVKGHKVEFAGPRVYWLETYATVKRDDDTPNDMWANRPRGQIEKCAEAAALRAAFPEEVGSDYIPEEVQHRVAAAATTLESTAVESLDGLADKLLGASGEIPVGTPDEAADVGPDDVYLENARKRFAECNLVGGVRDLAKELSDGAPNDATRGAIDGLAIEATERIKGGRGEASNKK